jgi:hypothetical protein
MMKYMERRVSERQDASLSAVCLVRVCGDTKHRMPCCVLPYDYMETAFRSGSNIDFTGHTVTYILTCRRELKAFHVLTSGILCACPKVKFRFNGS